MKLTDLTIENPGKTELRKFGLIFGAIVSVLFGLLLPWLFDYAWPVWPWIVAGVFWVWGLAAPGSMFFVYRIWLQFGQVAGWINTRIIMSILFYVVFFPAGMIMRLFGKDPMTRRLDRDSSSYRKASTPIDKDHFERPY